jgi:hypothetical protein
MEPVPFAIGQSPFHCKGVSYRNVRLFLDASLEGGHERFLAGLRNSELRAFLAQPFLPSSWYDALPMIPFAHDAARQRHTTTPQLMRELATFSIKRDASGIYKLLLKFTSPESLLERSTHTARQYFDFVLSEFELVGPKCYRLRHSGIPAVLAPLYMSLVEGYVDIGLEMAGARDVRQHWDKPEAMGMAHGVAVQRLAREIRWR